MNNVHLEQIIIGRSFRMPSLHSQSESLVKRVRELYLFRDYAISKSGLLKNVLTVYDIG